MKCFLAFVFALPVVIWQFGEALVGFAKGRPDYAGTLPRLHGINVNDKLPIARGGDTRSGLWITCPNDQRIRLALNTRLPIEKEFAGIGTFSGIHMEISVLRDNIRTYANIKQSPRIIFEEAVWQRTDESDVLFTSPMSTNDIRRLFQSFVSTAPAIVRIDAAETGTEMAGIVDGKAISGFASKCIGNSMP